MQLSITHQFAQHRTIRLIHIHNISNGHLLLCVCVCVCVWAAAAAGVWVQQVTNVVRWSTETHIGCSCKVRRMLCMHSQPPTLSQSCVGGCKQTCVEEKLFTRCTHLLSLTLCAAPLAPPHPPRTELAEHSILTQDEAIARVSRAAAEVGYGETHTHTRTDSHAHTTLPCLHQLT